MIELALLIACCIACLLLGILIGAAKADLRAARKPENPIDEWSEAAVILAQEAKSKGMSLIEYIKDKS